MATSPFVVDRFGGLNVYEDPQEVGAASAIDLLNVDFDQRGRIRSRDGSTALTAAAASPHTNAMAYSTAFGGAEQIITRVGTTVTPYALSNGAAGTTQSASPTSNNAFARFGDPSTTRTYMAAGTLYEYNATGWASVTAPISPTLCAVTANDNRLAISDGARIHWSNAGDPNTFGANNFVDLWPGDGETITALTRWQDLLFAFKQTKFAVFTGTDTDTDGEPIFRYRSVDAGRGASGVGQAVAGEEGVYFTDLSGIYVTAGGPARYISRQLEPWIADGAHGSLPSLSLSSAVLVYVNRRLYVTYPNNASSVTLVYDPVIDAWTVWQMGAVSMAAVPSTSSFRGIYFGEFTSKKVAKLDPAVSTDQGAAVSWSYTSGAYDLSGQNRVSITLESAVWGTGAATLKVANDHEAFDTGSALTLGTSPAVAQTWQQIDREGTYWQHQLSGSSAMVVNRLAHYVSFVKPAGVE